MSAIEGNLSKIRTTLGRAQLIAVSKGQGAEPIQAALGAGQRVFGENRVQEAAEKFPPLRRAYPDLQLHLIGPLQSNKVEQALQLFDVIHTLDRDKLALEFLKYPALLPGKEFFIQVNTGAEPQKSGVLPKDADAFIDICLKNYRLPVVGLMCIPPLDQDPIPHFQMLTQIAAKHSLPELSMGMSGDYKQAIASGATMVRIGSAIFGQRE